MPFFKGKIYLDYASLTPIDRRVMKEMRKWSQEPLNPSSIHSLGVKGKKALEEARKACAGFLSAHADEIVFTSGGTETNGLALEGAGRVAHRNGIAKPHIVISGVEHASIMETANMLEKHGVEVTRLKVDANGVVDLAELKRSITPSTYMISIMTVNNEIGTIQPIREIAKTIRDARKKNDSIYPLFHTDACQAVLLELNVEKLGVDLLTLDGAKSYGPRGIGCLYVKRGTPIEQIMYGGGQEKGLRSGTENIPAIMGFAKSFEIAKRERDAEDARLAELRRFFEAEVRLVAPKSSVNGSGAARSAHISNISFPGNDAEMLVLRLDAKGIACSTKSACLRDEDESYVLKAIGADSKSSVRFSFGRGTRKAHLKKALSDLKKFSS